MLKKFVFHLSLFQVPNYDFILVRLFYLYSSFKHSNWWCHILGHA